jgi:hypothetical protein
MTAAPLELSRFDSGTRAVVLHTVHRAGMRHVQAMGFLGPPDG